MCNIHNTHYASLQEYLKQSEKSEIAELAVILKHSWKCVAASECEASDSYSLGAHSAFLAVSSFVVERIRFLDPNFPYELLMD